MNRRKFLTYVSCGCCGFVLNSCSTAPITERRQLKIVPEAKLNAQAAQIYEKIKEREKLSKDTKKLEEIKYIGSGFSSRQNIRGKSGMAHSMNQMSGEYTY